MDPSVEQLWQQAAREIENQQVDLAHRTLETLLQRDPTHTPARMRLASLYLACGRLRLASKHAVAAVRSVPEDGKALYLVADFLAKIGEMKAAHACLHHPAAVDSRDGRVQAALAYIHHELGDHAGALRCTTRALAAGYDHGDLRYIHSLQLEFNGRVTEAENELEACLSAGSACGRVALTLARLRKQTATRNHVDTIRARLATAVPGSDDQGALEFALFEELEDLGQYAAAFAALERGNSILHQVHRHDIAREGVLFERVRALCTHEFVQSHGTKFDGPMPIFIVGLPRSGTTLVDRILDAHSAVASIGEPHDFARQLRWVADCQGWSTLDEALLERAADIDGVELGRRYLFQTQWRAPGKAFFIDKMPANFMFLGFIARALPQARILHLVRDPLDVCFSNYKALFGKEYPYSYDFRALAAHHAHYLGLMQHWHTVMPGRILDVNYKELVSEPERLIPAILEHCGLPYEPACGDPSRNPTAIGTLSSQQVREPIHTRNLGQWQRYATQLEPLRALLS